MIKKINEVIGKVSVVKDGTKKISYTLRFVRFNPNKHFVGTQEAKDIFRKMMHLSKKRMTEEYDSVYATVIKVGRGKSKHFEFNVTPKSAADIIFIVPKKHRREAYKHIQEMELYTEI